MSSEQRFCTMLYMNTNVQKAVSVLQNGGIVIYPTDTVYGIGCRIDDSDAVKRLYRIRKRIATKPSPVLGADINMLQGFLQPISKEVRTILMQRYWPGGLTIVHQCVSEKIPSMVRGGTETLGDRIPNYTLIQERIALVGAPIIGTSANFSGERTPCSYEELDPMLVSQVDFVVKGACLAQESSTVIDVTTKPWKIVRQGAVQVDITNI